MTASTQPGGAWSHAAYLEALARYVGIEGTCSQAPRVRHVHSDGLRLSCLDWGEAHEPALLLLHGGGQSAHTWDAFCLAMGRGWRCVALDQRGHGNSAWSATGAYSMHDHARDLEAVIAALGLRQPVLVGMSMGGIHALAYAAGHAATVRGLVSVDIGPEAQREPVDRLMAGLDSYRRFDSPADAAERLSRLGARRPVGLLQATLSLNLRELADGSWTWKYDPRTLVGLTADQIMAARRPLWGMLHRIVCPVLIVRGADSDIFSPQDASRLAAALPDARVVEVPRARHSVQTDNPRALAETVRSFVAALS